jgi:hypothetical protein
MIFLSLCLQSMALLGKDKKHGGSQSAKADFVGIAANSFDRTSICD